jgi:hypothetical protein
VVVVVVVLVVVVLVVDVLVDVLADVLVGAPVVEVLVLGDVVGDVIDDEVVDVAVRGGSVVPVTTVVVVARAAVASGPSDRAVELQAVNAPATKRRSVLARRSDTQLRVAPQPRPATAPLAGLRSSHE